MISQIKQNVYLAKVFLPLCWIALLSSGSLAADSSNNNDNWPDYHNVVKPYIDNAPWLPDTVTADPQTRQELNVFITALHAMSYFSNIYQDTRYPDFWPVFGSAFNYGFNDPNDNYLFAAIDDDGVYKISGYRETVRILEFEVGSAQMQAWGRGGWGQTLSNFSLEEGGVKINRDGTYNVTADKADGFKSVELDENGYFEVILSPSRPDGYTGNWWKLEEGGVYIMVRRRAYDWHNEVDSRLAIDRLDVPALRPRRDSQEVQQRLSNLTLSVKNWTKFLSNWAPKLAQDGLVNKVKVFENWSDSSLNKDLDVTGGVNAQRYIQGVFDIKQDEALIVETVVPASCRYWMFHLTDMLMSSIDQMNRKSSINGHQAVLDSDGKFRAVVSLQDPGVPNWLDPGGHQRGVISGRWWSCSSAPVPKITKTTIDKVRQYLPEDTPVVTAAEREREIRTRKQALQLRSRW